MKLRPARLPSDHAATTEILPAARERGFFLITISTS
jgi:hypothetical protein